METPRLIVVKIGSSTLVDADGRLDHGYIDSLCAQIAALRERGIHVITVSSGAAAAGREVLGFETRPTDIPTLQACAATGQARLIESYERALAAHGLPCAQVLLTRRDVVDREGYLNARNTFERLLELGVVPIVNENDTVSVAEFTFGDNDMLGAIVSALVSADLYVILWPIRQQSSSAASTISTRASSASPARPRPLSAPAACSPRFPRRA